LSDVFLDQIQRILGVADNLIAFAAFVALFAEVVFIKGISAGTMRCHEQKTVFHGGPIKISGVCTLFYGFVHGMLLFNSSYPVVPHRSKGN
jgi:hypothetical protein